MRAPSTCPKCAVAKANAKAAGQREWRRCACFDCSAGDLDAIFASIGYVPDEAAVARELAKMSARRRLPSAPVQPDLFEAAA